MLATIITLVTVGLFVLGVPIVLVMALWVAAISYFVVDLSLSNMGQTVWYGLENFSFLALPLFILTGDVVLGGGIARRLAAFANALVGWLRGGLAMATVMSCGFFASISGSNAATTATMGSIMIPEMTSRGYERVFAAATAAAGGTVGVIIPPSIIFIVYAVVMNVSAVDLFVAGLIPGALMVLFMMLMVPVIGHFRPGTIPATSTTFSARECARTAWGARHGFITVGLVLGSVYLGIFSPTESAALAVIYAWIAGVLFTRELPIRQTGKVMHRSAQINGLLVPIVALSLVLQQAISLLGVVEIVGEFLSNFQTRIMVIAIIMLIILLIGTIFESVPNVIMTAPILAPAAYAAGIDPIHFALIFLLGDTLGFITWPYGLNLFVASGITGIPYMRIAVMALWYCAALLIPWILVAAFPWITLGLLGAVR
jgi:C4-dicarboxylate transporter DctM subunit